MYQGTLKKNRTRVAISVEASMFPTRFFRLFQGMPLGAAGEQELPGSRNGGLSIHSEMNSLCQDIKD